MKKALLIQFLSGCVLALALARVHAAEEDDLISTLKSNVPSTQKWNACQRLRLIGSAKAVPTLATLLSDEQLSQAARHTLEGLPYPEAGAALREALGKTSGKVKAGIADSIGWRGENAGVPLLTPLLSDSDVAIATAAAASLGRLKGSEAIAALTRALGSAPAPVQPALQESLLKCAEGLLSENDRSGAAALYQRLYDSKYPVQVRTAAWRGLVLSDSDHRTDLLVKALAAKVEPGPSTVFDRSIQLAALKLLRQLDDRQIIQECVKQWPALPPKAQLAVLQAQTKLGREALPTVRNAGQSPNLAIRTAAWKAMGQLSDIDSVAVLSRAAARGDALEREAARESLAELRGPGAREALLRQLESSEPPEKAELLRALGERDDRTAVNVLIQNAASEEQLVRLAAVESLTRLAPPEAIAPLLDVAAKSKSDEQRDPVLKALYAVCEASSDKEKAARNVVEAMGRFPAAERRQVLPLLGELGTADALAAAQTASQDAHIELAKEAVRVLGHWPNAAPAGHLLGLARTASEPTLQTLALRGAIEVAGQEPDFGKRLAFLKLAFSNARSADEQRQVLGQIGQVPTTGALEVALQNLSSAELGDEASLAAVSIAEKLAPTNPKLGDEIAARVLSRIKEGDIARRAWALRIRPSSGASFIRDWVVCGPYRQAGIMGAEALFKIAFGPEKAGQSVEWKTAPPADHINLAGLFPGAENCVAYLRTRILAPQDCSAVLLMGSDDGIKAWLNGVVVHSNNVDRGDQADQDAAPIKLKKGANDLILKVTQGGGGWSACARIMGTDGKPISDLMVERPTDAGPVLSASGR